MASDSAWGEGWAQGREASQYRRDRKDMFSDEERQQKASDLIGTRNGILSKLPTLLGPNGEKTPEYDQAYQSLTEAQQGLGQLYHPDKAPGALQKDWHWLLGKMHGITAPKAGNTPAAPSQPGSMTLPTMPPAPLTTPEMPAYQQTTPQLDVDSTLHTHPGSTTENVPGTPSTTLPGMAAAAPPAAPPLLITQFYEGKPAPGMTAKGNLDLSKRPNIDNGDGTHSSTFSISFGTDKGEVLVPGVGDGKTYPERQLRVLYTLPDGSQKWAVPGNQPHNWKAPDRPTPQNNEALNQYQKTGKNFGTFEDAKAADAYGKQLHEDQEKHGFSGTTAHPVSQSGNITLPTPPSPKVVQAPAPSWGQAQVLKKKAAAMQKAQQEAALLVSGAPLSPQQQAMAKVNIDNAVLDAKIAHTMKLADDLGLSESVKDELKQQALGLKNVGFKPLTGGAGQPYSLDGGKTYVQNGSSPDGTVVTRPMPPGYKPNTKSIAGTVINTKQHGWIKTWVDPYTQKVTGWQPFTPGRTLTGTTSSSSSTDPFGLTTTSSRSTMPTDSTPKDFDFSGMSQLPESYNGEETSSGQASTSAPSGSPNKSPAPTSAPPKSVSKPTTDAPPVQTPSQLRGKVPAPPPVTTPIAGKFPLDSTGHIPTSAPYNASLIGAANDLLDGKDEDKLTIPTKAKEAAKNIARAYGWGGQGMFSPQQKLQIREASTFLNDAVKNDSLNVLDSLASRKKLIANIENSEGKAGFINREVAEDVNLNPKEAEFLRMYRQLVGTISGLASLTRPGRPTEAGIRRLMSELPDPRESHNASDGQKRLKRLIKEIEIATQKGNADNLFGSSPSASSGGGLSLDDFTKKHKIPPVKR